MSTSLTVAMAFSRKQVISKIEGQVDPLARVIMQIYLFGDTQTLNHWKKELRAIIDVVERNTHYKKGGVLSASDIVEALDQISIGPNPLVSLRELLSDDAYKTLVPRKVAVPSQEQYISLLRELADKAVKTVDSWYIAELLTNQILEW